MKSRHQKNKENDKIAKWRVQHKKQFLAKMKELCNQFAGYDVFSKFPPKFVDNMYRMRFYDEVKVVAAKGEGVPSDVLGYCDEVTKKYLKSTYIECPKTKVSVLFHHHFAELLTLNLNVGGMSESEFPEAKEIKEALKHCSETSAYYDTFLITLAKIFYYSGAVHSDMSLGLIWYDYQFEMTKTANLCNYFYVHRTMLDKINFTIDGNSRPAIRIGWRFPFSKSVRWVSIKPSQIGRTNLGHDEPMEVYVQSHALIRLNERLGMNSGLMHAELFNAIDKLICHTDESSRIYIHYSYFQKKLGYFVASVQDGKVLLHTFLFLTNNGTPEGKKLSALTGLQVMDKKYLAIDKLNTFLSYNINDDPLVRNIFVEAGCGELLQFDDRDKLPMVDDIKVADVATIANYIRLNRDGMRKEESDTEER